MRRLVHVLALALAGWSPLAAQSRIVTEVDSSRVTLGDRITLTVSVEHSPGERVVWPDSLDLAPFEVVQVRESPQPESMSGERSAVELTLVAFELGELEIPSFEVALIDSSGTREVLATDRYGVEVVSVGADESGDIRDIRGPLGIPMSVLRLLLWTVLPLVVVAILYAVARQLRSRKESTPVPALAPPDRPAHEVALAALAALEAAPLLDRGEIKEYHIRVSDILRTYVERRFRVDALEMTTHEVLVGLARSDADDVFREGLSAFLEQCDLVKFAKVRPGPEASRQVLELGRRLVLGSAPRSEPEGEPDDSEAPRGARAVAGVAAAAEVQGR